MCGGGGNASKAAQQQEAQRQAGVRRSVDQINQIYGSPARQQQYDDFEHAMQAYNLTQLDKQKTDADRNLNFALARQGLTGGSADVDASANLARQYNEGVLKSERAASGAAAGLRTQDQQSKQSLIGLAQSGLDATTASQQALLNQRAALDNAMAQGQAASLGDLFGGLASYYDQSNQARQLRDLLSGQQTNGLYGMQTNYQMPANAPGALALGGPRTSPLYLGGN